MRDTGFSQPVKRLIRERDGNACKRCCRPLGPDQGTIHHRRPRQRGGTRWPGINRPENGALVCDGCHRWIETHRTKSYEMGWLVHSWEDPAEVPWMTVSGCSSPLSVAGVT